MRTSPTRSPRRWVPSEHGLDGRTRTFPTPSPPAPRAICRGIGAADADLHAAVALPRPSGAFPITRTHLRVVTSPCNLRSHPSSFRARLPPYRLPPPPQMSQRVEGLEGQVYTVVRRFNDFVWLRNQLREALPYLIVPSLPEKQQIGRFNSDFVDVRLRALQRWVDRISVHPDVTKTGGSRRARGPRARDGCD